MLLSASMGARLSWCLLASWYWQGRLKSYRWIRWSWCIHNNKLLWSLGGTMPWFLEQVTHKLMQFYHIYLLLLFIHTAILLDCLWLIPFDSTLFHCFLVLQSSSTLTLFPILTCTLLVITDWLLEEDDSYVGYIRTLLPPPLPPTEGPPLFWISWMYS